MNLKGLRINERNHLEIGGCDCVDLVQQYGTPLYVMDEDVIRNNCRTYKKALDKYYSGDGMVLYASKAFCTLAICRIAAQEGLGLDVVSGGELYTAKMARFPMDRVYFHGNNKTPEELKMAVELGVRRIVVDNAEELEVLDFIASECGRITEISFRIKPGIDTHTHEYIKTGKVDSKFGISMENGEAFDAVKAALAMKNVRLVGFHCHIGSQIFDIEPFKLAARVMLDFISEIKTRFGFEAQELNLGGGFGVRYVEGDESVDYDEFIKEVAAVVEDICKDRQISLPFLVLEPGRSIVAPAGITLYTVGNVREIKDVRKYVSIDGGMTDNPRYALYRAKYEILLANRSCDEPCEKVTVAGKCCESGDIIAKDVMLPRVKRGDILAVLTTGAYNYSMSSNYNRLPRPAVVLVKDGKSRIIVKRESYDDIIRNDVLPEDL